METGTLDPILDNELKNLIQPPTSPFQISMRDELSDESRHPIFAEVCADAPADVSLLRRIAATLWKAAAPRGQ